MPVLQLEKGTCNVFLLVESPNVRATAREEDMKCTPA